MTYLGHIVSVDGLSTDPEKTSAVANWPTPTNLTEVRSFIGFCSYYRKFVKDFSGVAKPLSKLTEKGVKFVWTPECETAVQQLKQLLTHSPVLGFPREEGELILDTDASDFAVGAVLSQVQDGIERPLAFYSSALSKAEINYCVTRRELLAIVMSAKHFHHYLYGRPVLVRTDHGALQWLMSFKNPCGQVARWLQLLSGYDLKIQHRAGRQHGNADGLSRRPCTECKQCEKMEKNETEPEKQEESCEEHTETLTSDPGDSLSGREDRCQSGSAVVRVLTRSRAKQMEQPEQMRPINPDADDSGQPIQPNIDVQQPQLPQQDPPNDKPRVKLKETTIVNPCGSSEPQTPRIPDQKKRSCTQPVEVDNDEAVIDNGDEGHSSPIKEPGNSKSTQALPEKENSPQGPTVVRTEGDNGGSESWIESLVPDDWAMRQNRDPAMSRMRALKKKEEDRPLWKDVSMEGGDFKCLWAQWENLAFEKDVLCRKKEIQGKAVCQVLVPQGMRKEIIMSLHDDITGGHLGIPKTIERVRLRFYWPNYRQDVTLHCTICDKCNIRKPPARRDRAPMQSYVVGIPGERVAMDILGPFPVSSNGAKYILVVGCYFTRYIEAYALPDQESITIARVFVNEFVSRFGVPRIVHTDQGRNFESKLFKDMCSLMGIQKTRTCAFNPKSDGMIERMNRTILSMLAKYVNVNQKNWHEPLPLLMMAYRSTVHDSTKFSPNFLMFGRELQLPTDIVYGITSIRQPQVGRSEYVQHLLESGEEVFDMVRKNLKRACESQKKQYDVHSQDKHKFDIGDLVWFYDPTKKKGLSPKLQAKWRGPCRVLNKTSDVVRTVTLDAKGTVRTIHVDRLKPFTGENIPSWLRK